MLVGLIWWWGLQQVQGDCPPIGFFFGVVVCTLFILNPDLGYRSQVWDGCLRHSLHSCLFCFVRA